MQWCSRGKNLANRIFVFNFLGWATFVFIFVGGQNSFPSLGVDNIFHIGVKCSNKLRVRYRYQNATVKLLGKLQDGNTNIVLLLS